MIVVAAAGNAGADACQYSPGSTPGVITVGAVNSYDGVASFSNTGSCVDVFGPGVGITGPNIQSPPSGSSTDDGTSFAAPHVAGIAARLLQQMAPTFISSASGSPSIDDVLSTLLCEATEGLLLDVPSGSPNILAYLSPNGATVTTAGSTCVPKSCPAPCSDGTCMCVYR